MLELIDGCVFLENKKILDHVFFALRPEECVVIWGLNGVGKSSLLDILAAWKTLAPSQGEVFLNQKNMRDWDIQERAEVLAYLSQSQEVLFDDSVRELLKILDPLEILIESLARDFNVFNLLDRNFYSLSGGEKIKVALLRVILQLRIFNNKKELSGRYLLLDEPLAHLDQIYQQEFLSYLLKLKQEGLGILMVMHDLNLAWRYADRFFIYHDGKLHHVGVGRGEEGILMKKIKDFYGVDLRPDQAWIF